MDPGATIDAVGISIAGFVDYKRDIVRLSRAAGWAEGDLAAQIRDLTGAESVYVMNDGEAHALYMRTDRRGKGGVICLALGTSVGMGVLDSEGNVVRPLSCENWDIGNLQLVTRASDSHVWWCLGSDGLKELTDSFADRDDGYSGYKHYGYRLGNLLVQLVIIFMPGTIALTGGIIQGGHGNEILACAKEELMRSIPGNIDAPNVIALDEEETAIRGMEQYIKSILSERSISVYLK